MIARYLTVLALTGAIVVLAFPGCTVDGPPAEPADLIGDVAPTVRGLDASPDRLVPLWEHEPPFDAIGMHSGDVIGDSASEVVLIGESEIEILAADGSVMRAFELPPPQALDGFLADADGDGKLDIVLGSAGDVTSRVRVLNGQGDVVLEATLGALVNGYTRPTFATGGFVYFTSGSTFRSTPRVTGRVEIRTGTVEWIRSDGVLPMGLVYSRSLDLVAVHNRGVSRDLEGAAGWSDSRPDRSAILLSSPDGRTRVFTPQGAPVLEGFGGPGQVSSVHSIPLAMDDGTGGALVVANRESTRFEGPSQLLVVDANGTVLRRREGPPASFGELALLEHGSGRADDEPLVVVGWGTTGVVELIDTSLDPQLSVALPGVSHDLSIAAIVPAESVDDARILVRDQDRLGVISPTAGLLALYQFDGEIRHVAVVGPPAEPRLAVFTRRAHIFGLRDADASDVRPHRVDLRSPPVPSAPEAPDGVESTVVGEPPGVRLVPVSHVADEPGLSYLGAFNVIGDDRPELVFRGVSDDRVIVRDDRLQWVTSFVLPERARSLTIVDDVDGDGRSDIAYTTDDEFASVVTLRGDGTVISRVGFSYLFDSVLAPRRSHGGLLLVSAVTGHMEWPRGLYGVDADAGAIRFFYPIAAFVNVVVAHDDALYISNYTPDNGATVERPDGTMDTDGAMFLHAIHRDGSIHPHAGPVDLGEPRGLLNFFLWDADSDGADEVHAVVRRSAPYNPGKSGVYRVDDDGSLVPVIEGSRDSQAMPEVVRIGDADHLALRWSDRADMLVYGPGYVRVGAFPTQDPGYTAIVDADRDGTPELLSIRDGALVYRDSATGGERHVRSPDAPFRTVRVHESGVGELVAVVHGDSGYLVFHLTASDAESAR